MNRTPWRRRQEPLDHAELARLLPAPGDPDLPRDRRRLLEEQLMREIQPTPGTDRSPVRPVRRALFIGAPLTALAVAGVMVAATLGGGDDGSKDTAGSTKGTVVQFDAGSTEKVAATVSRISAAAESREFPEPRADQYLYFKSTVSYLRGGETNGKPWYEVEKPHSRETWFSPDGRKGHLYERGKHISLDNDRSNPGVGSPTYNYLKSLPADPDFLLKKIYQDTKGQGSGPHQQAFLTIGDLLRENAAPPKLSAALYRAAAEIPGVVVVDHAKDAAGRDGIAIARVDEEDQSRSEWIFDRKSYAYTGERTVQLKALPGIKAGTVTGNAAVLDIAVVDRKRERPDGDDRR
ncbi:CU044_5270 family protein [Streptomyces sp. NPDC001985]|uniref:CU044_5270 family protein n=1 Tax=Streptomyces sp. NPDC001985 TaxID=3154406 RepID=UPI003321584B